MKYAVLIKHAFRSMSDIRIEIVDVPKELQNVGPVEVKELIASRLIGNFEIVAVTDRISEQKWRDGESK